MLNRAGRPRVRLTVRFLSIVILVFGGLTLAPGSAIGVAQFGDESPGLADRDARTGSVAPTSAQLALVSQLGATARWNNFGTVQSLIKYGGYLATGLGSDPVVAARSFIDSNRALFRLGDQGLANLELLNDSS